MNKSMKISLIVLIVVPAIIIPIAYLNFSQRQSSSELLLLTLNSKPPSLPQQETADFPISIEGSAVSANRTMNYTDFMTWSNFSAYVIVKGKMNEVPFETNNSYEGIPFMRVIYTIMNVSAYSTVKVTASDGYYKVLQKGDIENPDFCNDLILAYKMNGQNFTDYYKPVYGLIQQHFTIANYGDEWNGQYCVRHIVKFEINS